MCVCAVCAVQDHLKKIQKEFGGKDGAKLLKMTPKTFTNACRVLYDGMRQNLNKTSGPALLKEYSPWLYSFHTSSSDLYTDTIEVPGQLEMCREEHCRAERVCECECVCV